MLEILGWAVLAIVVAGGLCALAVTVLPAGEQIAPALRDEPVWALPPERTLAATDVDDVRLPVALRGYRFAETDQLLDRLAEELRARDLEIARLRDGSRFAQQGTTVGVPSTDPADATSVDEPTATDTVDAADDETDTTVTDTVDAATPPPGQEPLFDADAVAADEHRAFRPGD